jgi:hypothetical protein
MNPARRRRIWRLGTVLPAIASAVLGLGAVALSETGAPHLRAVSWQDGSPVGNLDRTGLVPGGMRAIGWDLDPNARTKPVRTFARVDNRWVAGTTSDIARSDVLKAHPLAGANHGFNFVIPVPEGRHVVCIGARNLYTGHDTVFRCLTWSFDYGPLGSISAFGTKPGAIHVSGWTFDRDAFSTPITTVITIDGTAHNVVANAARPVVPAATYGNAGPNHGFDVTYPVSQGSHRVCVTTKNVGYGTDNSLGCKTLTLQESPVGNLDSAGKSGSRLRVTGWAYDPDALSTALSVAIRIDSTTYTTVADIARRDVEAAHPGVGQYHGFAQSYTVPEGSHKVCVTVRNVSFGSDLAFPCRTVAVEFTPTAALLSLSATSTGARVTGWATDPDTSSPIPVVISVDGRSVATLTANRSGNPHSGHQFATSLTLKSGNHTVCATAKNVLYGTHDSTPACRTISLALRPLGAFESLTRASGSTDLQVTGWALDPDTNSPLSVTATLDGASLPAIVADATRTDIGQRYPYGNAHGISTTITADDGEHTVCLTAKNVGGGTDLNLGCKIIIAVHPTAPSAPQNVNAQAGYGGATLTWSPPASDGGAPWTNYTVTASPGGASVTTGPTTTTATITGLKPSTTYSFTVTATNVAGTSAAATSASVKTQASPPAQTTPAPVSTSRYIRNVRGASSTEQATLRSEGKADAIANPSGHGYLILLDIGGQDQYDGGVVLSATTRFITYGNLVTDIKAYIDGYHSGQRASAPITIAIGTNNDMDVTSAAGKAWATQVVNPLVSYASKYTGMTIAGANDIEPGFRASYSATKNWLTGYLSATSAPFVFNGSADGCSWSQTSRGCNNGWNMSGLYYLAAGAAPIRMLNLPQIYNTTMAAQWKYISLTGIAQNQPRINFAGTLTEWTACDQSNSCGSLTGHTAWSTLWSNLQSDSRLKVGSLPYSTDLRIDS